MIHTVGQALLPFVFGSGVFASTPDCTKRTLYTMKEKVSTQEKKETIVFLGLQEKYALLEELGYKLATLDSRFTMRTSKGRAAISIALTLAGTEVHGLLQSSKDFFTIMGGYKKDPKTGKILYNKMKGFAQFDVDLHGDKINTPEKYAKHLGDIITGISRMPNSTKSRDFVSDLEEKITNGTIKNKKQFINWFKENGFGGSNWQGINDGWKRIKDLPKELIEFVSFN